MMPSKRRRPDLDHCVRILESVTRELSTKPPKSVAEIYVAAVGLLYHLKLDQATLRGIRKQNEGKETAPFPKPNAIPAIAAVIHNQALFRALVSCLSSKNNAGDVETESSKPLLPPASRKRTHSFGQDDLIVSKSMKISHSPQVAKRTFSYARPQMNVRTISATILYIAFEHIDHWPVPLVKAYAEDCFGPRHWVDEPACQLLVKNLALSHLGTNDDAESENNIQTEADAFMVAEFYRVEEEKTESHSPSPTKHKKRGSMSSLASHSSSLSVPSLTSNRPRSSSCGSFEAPEPKVIPTNRPRSSSCGSSEAPEPKVLPTNRPRSSSSGSFEAPEPKVIPTAPSITKDGEESDSGDEEEVAVATSVPKQSSADNGDSSSSGEEDEEVVETSKSFDDESVQNLSSGSEKNYTDPPPSLNPTYPVVQHNFNFKRIRQRYFGLNLGCAHLAISSSLNDRLDVKSKQNSGLLQSLPAFTSIPSVRTLITANLEKWLQSPALAGLGRSLFSRTVNMMKNVDPPLPADLEAIDNILSMRLKANQLNAHIENVTAIATKIPTATVSHYIYSHLLQEVLLTMDNADMSVSDHLKMFHAVHNALPNKLSADGIAASLLTLLVNRPESLTQMTTTQLVKRLRALIRAIANELGGAFDGCMLLQALLSFNVGSASWTVSDEENKARLLFQCMTLLAVNHSPIERNQHSKSTRKVELSAEEAASLKKKLKKARKLLLSWCCADYAPLCSVTDSTEKGDGKKKQASEAVGAGPADYDSILDGLNNSKFPWWLDVMRCLLFMEDASSARLKQFLVPDGSFIESDPDWQDEGFRLGLCCEHGADLDDEMVWIVLKAATNKKQGGMPPDIALPLLEHLFNCCSKNRKASLCLEDPNFLWELYTLVEYIQPTLQRKQNGEHIQEVKIEGVDPNGTKGDEGQFNGVNSSSAEPDRDIARLAYPGMWWRVTGLALIMCGSSPKNIGSVAWKEHPTLRTLMKMVTSDRYKFPTVDCDEAARDNMKSTEQSMRDEELKITELLFLQKKPKKKKKEISSIEASYGGSRVSRRQTEKREKLLKKQREKEAAEARAEANRRKKLLRAAQKSIMLWDPTKGPRKPPKESADLIFSVGELFDLPRKFQRSVEPDLVLMTIGNTTRGAIERAYDWLIPIISFVPDTIARLPASASCFLLLRAYGTEGEERTQLQELAAPLLVHVRDSLMGKFGEADAVRAFDLLLTDVASHNPDRRRCARRVLHDAIGKENLGGSGDSTFAKTKCAWMINLLHVEHISSILSDAIKYMACAASFERERILRFLLLALEKLTKYAIDQGIPGRWDFPSMLIGLISNRPTVFAATMGSFPDLRSLAIRVVHNEFKRYIKHSADEIKFDSDSAVKITLCCESLPDSKEEVVEATLPLSLLKSACVLLSIWLETDRDDVDNKAVGGLVRMLMRPQEAENSVESGENKVDGLASACMADSGKSAIPVESWVMLARSRSDFIAKRAALTAPTGFLPRLLLCSGLPRASLLTMIDRLGRLGDKAGDKTKVFNQLLVPSAASEWDIGRLGHRREVLRKLMGRLSAYSRMYKLSKLGGEEIVSLTFLEWLSESCKIAERPKKSKSKKMKPSNLERVESILDDFSGGVLEVSMRPDVVLDGDASDMTVFRMFGGTEEICRPKSLGDINDINRFFEIAFERNETIYLETWLTKNYSQPVLSGKKKRKREEETTAKTSEGELAFMLLKAFVDIEQTSKGHESCILKWVPKLSISSGSPKFWKLLFSTGQEPSTTWRSLVARCCQTWSHPHISQCRSWILSHGKEEDLELDAIVRFLVQSSSLGVVSVESFVTIPLDQIDRAWGRSEDMVVSATKFALDCLVAAKSSNIKDRLCSRHGPPDCIVLLLLIAGLGRKQLQCVSQAVVERISKADEETRVILLAVILRLYAFFPQSMNLGVAILRSVLKEAVEAYSSDWLSWRSPLDDEFQDMLDSVVTNGAPVKLVLALAEGSKKHPLLMLRKLGKMGQVLERDGAVCERSSADEKRGIVYGQSLNDLLPAKVQGKLIKLTVKHWGFNFTDSIWVAFLDIISTVPREVLFGCGLKMGLLDFLGVYLRLMFVQTQLRSDRLPRLKGKLSEFFDAFTASNVEGWEAWLGTKTSGLSSLGATRNVLMSCDFISHQQAIDSIKKAKDPSNGQART